MALPLIRISPSEFQFFETKRNKPDSGDTSYTSRLRLTSLHNSPVGFKFKTNSPHKFLVKPVVFALDKKGASIEVVVKSTSEVLGSDRFLIQTVALTQNEAMDGLDSAKWRKLDPARIMEDLIHCTSIPSTPTDSNSGIQEQEYNNYRQQHSIMENGNFKAGIYHDEKNRGLDLKYKWARYLPGLDLNKFSWAELVVFGGFCLLVGFCLPVLHHVLTG